MELGTTQTGVRQLAPPVRSPLLPSSSSFNPGTLAKVRQWTFTPPSLATYEDSVESWGSRCDGWYKAGFRQKPLGEILTDGHGMQAA